MSTEYFMVVETLHYMDLHASKPVFGVSEKVRLKPVFSAS